MSIFRTITHGLVHGAARSTRYINVPQHTENFNNIQGSFFDSTSLLVVICICILAYIFYSKYKNSNKNKLHNTHKNILGIDFWKEKLKKPKEYGRFFCVDGRVGRLTFFLYYMMFTIVSLIFAIVLRPIDEFLFWCALLCMALIFICLLVKRIHDLGFSGFWSIIYIFLAVNSVHIILALLMLPLFLLKGSDKPYTESKLFLSLKTHSNKIKRILFFIIGILILIIIASMFSG